MIVYLAAVKPIWKQIPDLKDYYLLTSFYEYHNQKKLPEYVYQEKHIADSGAFSTFKSLEQAKKMDWDNYVNKYINFVKETKSKLYFEMDIDSVVGLQKVEYYRKLMQDKIGYSPIPVWHANRKWEYYQMMCEEFEYVALGTTQFAPEGKLIRKNPAILKKFINEAHSKGAKIHGLGFTSQPWLEVLDFDSVDSTSWLASKFGVLHYFNGCRCEIVKKKNDTDRMIGRTSDYHVRNFYEWTKYQKYKL